MPETAEMKETQTRKETAEKNRPEEGRQSRPGQEAQLGGQGQPAQGQGRQSEAHSGVQGRSGSTSAMSRGGEGRGMTRRHPLEMGFSNPFAMMRALSDEMDRIFESFGLGGVPALGRSSSSWSGLERGGGAGERLWMPQIDVRRRGDELVVCADLPGMKKEDLQVEVQEDQLVLQGERREEQENEEGGLYRSERSYGRFFRTVPLPQGVDADQANATFKDGVLEIRMPLPQEPQERSRRIDIR